MIIPDAQVEAACDAYWAVTGDRLALVDFNAMRAALEAAAQSAPVVNMRAALELAWSHCDPFDVPDADIAIIEAALMAVAQAAPAPRGDES